MCEAALLQAVGRARAVNRTAADPVLVVVLTDVPLPLEVDAVVEGRALAGDLWTRVAGELPVIPADQAALAGSLPGLFSKGARSVEGACEADPGFARRLEAIRRGRPVWLPWAGLALPAVVRGRRGRRHRSVPVAVRFGAGLDEAVARVAAAAGLEDAALVGPDWTLTDEGRAGLLDEIAAGLVAIPPGARDWHVPYADGVVRDRTGRPVEAREAASIVLEAAQAEARRGCLDYLFP